MRRRSLIAWGAFLSVAVTANGAFAQKRAFNVPAGPAVASIPEFARQAGLQIIAPADQLAGLRTPAIVGVRDARAALEALIAGANLEIASDDGGVISLRNSKPKADQPPLSSAGDEPVVKRLTPVVVTGSRVIANGNDSPTPVTVALADEMLDTQPASIVDGLNTLPALLGSITSSSNASGPNTANLRGVGTLRGLILFDGHRIGPTQNNGAVSIDVIPQMLLQRVDVVTGGASAVYGSDAVSGVLNFITDTRFRGLKLNLQGGVSGYGDQAKPQVGIAVGAPVLDGRGHLEASYEFRDSPAVARASRPWFKTIWTEQGSVAGGGPVGSATNPYRLTAGAVLATASFGGLVISGPLNGLNFSQNGVLGPFVHGSPTGTAGVEVGGQGAYYTGSSIAIGQQAHQAFARFDYDFGDRLHGFVQAAVSRNHYAYVQQNLLLSKVSIGYDNAFLSTLQPQYQAVVAAQLADNPLGSFQLSKMDTVVPDQRTQIQENYLMVVAGLDGSLGTYDWDVGYTHTDSRQAQQNDHGVDNARLYAALNAVVNPADGRIVCHAALVNPSVYGGCVPLDVFGPTAESQAAVDYVRHVPHALQTYVSDDLSATLKGAPFRLPAGPAAMAVSAEWRRLTHSVGSDSPPMTPVDCAGIQFNCTASSVPFQGGSVAPLSAVSQTVSEIAYETDLPLLADDPFADALNLNGAVRYTTYNTSGSVWTWKIGLDWKIDADFTLRATRSRDIRAPNLNDLFAPRGLALTQYVDIHSGGAGVIANVTQGNPNLTPEIADTTTAGVVWRPASAPGFSLSLDGYRILIANAIVTISAFQPATQQACEASGGLAQVCSLYIRPLPFSNRTAANYPLAIVNESLNVAALDAYGLDAEANYATRLLGRRLSLRGLVNWQPHLLYNNGPGGMVDVGGAADGVNNLPAIAGVKLLLSATWDVTDAWRVHLQERWRGPERQNGSAGLYFADGMLAAAAFTDLTVSYSVNRSLQAFLNVQNLFDTPPIPWASAGGSVQPNYLGGFAQGDDILGRYFTLGLRLRL
jgi:outer membrane receptor protein involved in Fe transport